MNTPITRISPKKLDKRSAVIPAMVVVLLLLMVLATAVGAVYVPFGQALKVILKKAGILASANTTANQENIIFLIRLPRVIVASIAGAALATCGSVMQGMFRNPMADPGILGVSSGAGLGAVTAIALGLSARSIYFLPLFASVGAITAVGIIYVLSVRGGKIPTLTLILSGIAVSTFIGAITQLVLVNSNDYEVNTFIFWTMGGLNGMMWQQVKLIILPVILFIIILTTFARDLNILLLGEEEAQSLGLDPSKTRKLLLLLTSLTTAVAISVCGPVSFIGLIVPHILRLIVGPDHRILIPASAVGGAIFLVCCDIVARIPPSGEIGVGIVTSLLGAPYFLYLLIKARKEGAVI